MNPPEQFPGIGGKAYNSTSAGVVGGPFNQIDHNVNKICALLCIQQGHKLYKHPVDLYFEYLLVGTFQKLK